MTTLAHFAHLIILAGLVVWLVMGFFINSTTFPGSRRTIVSLGYGGGFLVATGCLILSILGWPSAI